MRYQLLEDNMDTIFYGILEVHSHTKSINNRSTAVSTTIIPFVSREHRERFSRELVRHENLDDVSVRRIFTNV